MNYFRAKPTENLLVLKSFYFFAALLWSVIVAFFCLIQLNAVPFNGISNLDKGVHAFFHFVFTLLWFLFFQKQFNTVMNTKPLLVSLGLSVLFGISIEIAQELFTTTRHADVFDVLANTSGALIAVIAIAFFSKYIKFAKTE